MSYNSTIALSAHNVTGTGDWWREEELERSYPEPEGHAGPRWGLLGLVIIPTWILCGNMLVLLAVVWNRNLRTLSNYVIASLASTDFMLALTVVPLGTYQLVRSLPFFHSLVSIPI